MGISRGAMSAHRVSLPVILVPKPNLPDDPDQSICRCDRGDIVAAGPFEMKRALAERIGIFPALGMQEHGPRAMNEKHPDVDFAMLADPTEFPTKATSAVR